MRCEFKATARKTVRGTHYVVIPAQDARWLEQETGAPLKGRSLKVELEV